MIPSTSMDTTDLSEKSRVRHLALHGIVVAGLAFVSLVMIGFTYDMHLVEKVLTRTALPCGLVWLGLLTAIYAALLQGSRKLAALLAFTCVTYWFVGCTLGSQYLVSLLERDYAHVDVARLERLDSVIVLGGGTATNPVGDVWLSSAGDRVNLGAILYLQGKTPQLVTTGTHYAWAKPDKHEISSGTAWLWRQMGVPESAIIKIAGQNTTEEMAGLRQWLNEHPVPRDKPNKRLGLVTSAFHMRRAMRLARNQQLEFVPLPCDFRTRVPDPFPLAIIPHGLALSESESVFKELLAQLLNR